MIFLDASGATTKYVADHLPTFVDLVTYFGPYIGFILFLIICFNFWVYRLYVGRLKERQDEINRLAEENKEWRERFQAMLDKNFSIKKQRT